MLPRADRCLLRTGRRATAPVARLRRRDRGPRGAGLVLRPDPGPRRARLRSGAVTSLSFQVVGARAEPYAAVPTLMLRLRVTEADGQPVHAAALRCQVMIEPQRRRYEAAEEGQ